jgi:hypothetical protein
MRSDPAWAQARSIPPTNKQARAQAFSALRKQYHFSEYELHEYAKLARVSWIADHIDSVEGKRNDVGLRFVLDPTVGDGGFLIWNTEVIPAIIDWLDPVVQHGIRHTIKYVRLMRPEAWACQLLEKLPVPEHIG